MNMRKTLSKIFNNRVMTRLRPLAKGLTVGVGVLSFALEFGGAAAAAPVALAVVTGVAILATATAVADAKKSGVAAPRKSRRLGQSTAHHARQGNMAVLTTDGRLLPHKLAYV